MKNFPPQFAAHLVSAETSLCTCWRLKRQDGLELGFTDHDAAISFDGLTFRPQTGFVSSDATQKLGAATSSTDIEGVIHSSAVTEIDLELGRYHDATIETYWVNWKDPSVRTLLSRHTIGNVSRHDTYFRAELRSAQSTLSKQTPRYYQSLCGTFAGTAECGVDLQHPSLSVDVVVAEVRGRHSLNITGADAFADGWFGFGQARFTSGARHSLSYQIVADSARNGARVLEFSETVADHTAAGDSLHLTAGCDRRFATCKQKFANHVNFRGFPHIPGTDFLMSYPKEGSALSGGILVK